MKRVHNMCMVDISINYSLSVKLTLGYHNPQCKFEFGFWRQGSFHRKLTLFKLCKCSVMCNKPILPKIHNPTGDRDTFLIILMTGCLCVYGT